VPQGNLGSSTNRKDAPGIRRARLLLEVLVVGAVLTLPVTAASAATGSRGPSAAAQSSGGGNTTGCPAPGSGGGSGSGTGTTGTGTTGSGTGTTGTGTTGTGTTGSGSGTTTTCTPKIRTKVLSNETTHTTWAFANYPGKIRTQPSKHSRAFAKLLIGTPDGLGLQAYVLLSEEFIPQQGTWVHVRVPGRPNGRTGWVQIGELAQFNVVHTELIVNRAQRKLTLYRWGKVIYRAPVGVGKPSTPTPPGHFWITEAFVSTDPFYGPYAFGTTDYSTLSEWPGGGVVGLHGTNEPQLVPGDPSHGCIRLHNSDISKLENKIQIGTPIWVQ